MRFMDLGDLLTRGAERLRPGPVALVFAEDEVELNTTLRHLVQTGFPSIVVFMAPVFELAEDVEKRVARVDFDATQKDALFTAVNAVIAAAPGVWMHYCYNAEYFFFPFCESRSITELVAFHAEERRSAMLTYVVDLYAADLERHPNSVSLTDAWLDQSGYYALARPDPKTNFPRERQLDFFGGLRWRFEEHIPKDRRKIDRIALFQAKEGLELQPDHTFNDQEYNTYACPWHNNLTASLVSFRTAKALKRNPGSSHAIDRFHWHNSVRFEWTSNQLLDLGLMEPGQWF